MMKNGVVKSRHIRCLVVVADAVTSHAGMLFQKGMLFQVTQYMKDCTATTTEKDKEQQYMIL